MMIPPFFYAVSEVYKKRSLIRERIAHGVRTSPYAGITQIRLKGSVSLRDTISAGRIPAPLNQLFYFVSRSLYSKNGGCQLHSGGLVPGEFEGNTLKSREYRKCKVNGGQIKIK
jgi:hypothetical protein